MKKTRLLLILLIVLASGYWWATRSRTPSETTGSAQSADSAVTTSASSAPESASASLPQQAPRRRSKRRVPSFGAPPANGKLEGNQIEFRVVGGLAIAYGDVLLGEPEEGSTITQGVYDSPNPQLWDKPEIPYAINPDLPNPERVQKAIDYFNQHTPVSFIPYQAGVHTDAIVFEPGDEHCYSYLGRLGGLQPIKLHPDCQTHEIMHEMMHALGFVHEQSRTDRDQYVQVIWDNIEDKYRSEFAIVPASYMEALKGPPPFDYHSIMLYDATAFAIHDSEPTLKSIGKEPIAPVKDGMSPGDIRRLYQLYRPDQMPH